MTTVNLNNEHTAITTWSGFVYQGKIATYHCLQLLQKNIKQDGISLQLDYFEDFSVVNKDGKAISLHQVKALKSKSYGTYADAFDQLREKQKKHCSAIAYFHLAQKINNKTNKEIEDSHSPIKIYLYEAESCAPLKKIDELIEESIKKFYETHSPDERFKITDEYIKTTRIFIDQLVLKQTLIIHAAVHASTTTAKKAAKEKTIELSEFLSILSSDLNTIGKTKEYYLFLLKQDLYRYHEQFCYENESCTAEELEKMSHCLLNITSLDEACTIRFLRQLLPDREFKLDTLTDYKDNTLTQDGVRDSFLKMLRLLRTPDFDNEKFLRWEANSRIFTPTTIHHGPSNKEVICERIIKNALDTDLELMFEGGSLITSDIETESICAEAPEIIDSEDYDKSKENIITKWKRISLINIKNAASIIND